MTIHEMPALTRGNGGEPVAETDVRELKRSSTTSSALSHWTSPWPAPAPVRLRLLGGHPSPDAA
jgi:hypothetical protein